MTIPKLSMLFAIIVGIAFGLLLERVTTTRASAAGAMSGMSFIGNDVPASGCDVYSHQGSTVITICASGFSAVIK